MTQQILFVALVFYDQQKRQLLLIHSLGNIYENYEWNSIINDEH